MADYCSQCTPFNVRSDFDLVKIALSLKKGRSFSFLCEGCPNRAIYKDENGCLFIAKLEGKEISLFPVKLEELIPT